MIGAIAGDIIGSVYEFNNYKAKDFEPLFHKNCRYTDDTIMTIAVADILLNNKNVAENLRYWGRKYFNKGSWGKHFAFWLSSPVIKPAYNAASNGSAMKVSPCAWLAQSHEEAIDLATKVVEVTHNHPEGIKGAHATVSAIYLAKSGCSKSEIRTYIEDNYGYDLSRSVDQIKELNPHSELCAKTVPEAITCFLESTSFEDAIRNAISIGGDSDTIAAITGSIAEAMYYPITESIRIKSLNYLPDEMLEIYQQFNALIDN